MNAKIENILDSEPQRLSDRHSRALSGKRLLKYFTNFKESGILQRLMHYCNDEWNDFPQDVVTFVNEDKKPIVEVVVNENKILLDFLHMMQLDVTTGLHQPIAWIDVSGKCFFPEIDSEYNETKYRHLHLEIEMHGQDNATGRPTSPWISFPMLLAAISGKISAQDMNIVNDNYELFRNKMISREEFVEKLRLLVGDALLQLEIRNIHAR